MYRDKDNILKILISNAFSKKAVLQFKRLEKLEKAPGRPKHTLKVTWYKGENKLYVDGALVDVYPREGSKSTSDDRAEATRTSKQDSDIFRGFCTADPVKGSFTFSVSREGWLDRDGQFITMVPHVLTDNLEFHAYRDADNVFKVLISNPFTDRVLLQCKNLDELKSTPSHPKHEIEIGWLRGEIRLYIDGNLVDRYLQGRNEDNGVDKRENPSGPIED